MKSNEIILLQEVGRFIGIEEIFFNSEGFCLLQLQDRFSLIIRNDTIEQRLIIMAEVETPSKISEDLFHSLLAFNIGRITTPGAWIALDKNTKILFLVDEFLLTIEIEKFQSRLTKFFKQYLSFQNIFANENGLMLIKKNYATDEFSHLKNFA